MRNRAHLAPALLIIAAVVLLLAGCSSGHGQAAAEASSLRANPAASQDLAQVKRLFLPCIEPPGGQVPHIGGVISCAKSKVPAVQDKGTRRRIGYALGKCLLAAYQAAGSWAAFKTGPGWPACAQTAYNAALASGATPPPAAPASPG